MPETRAEMIDIIWRIIQESSEPSIAFYIEKVSSFIPDGGASMMFEYGRNVERPGCIIETIARTSGIIIRTVEITPKAWQKELGLGGSDRISPPRMPNGLDQRGKAVWKSLNSLAIASAKAHNDKAKREWKNKLKGEAYRRFPELKITLKNCDALLILLAAIQIEGSSLL